MGKEMPTMAVSLHRPIFRLQAQLRGESYEFNSLFGIQFFMLKTFNILFRKEWFVENSYS